MNRRVEMPQTSGEPAGGAPPRPALAWVVTVDMGYGHQRAVHAFRDVARERIFTANSDPVVSPGERAQWARFRTSYEGVSRMSELPLIGQPFWRLYDRFQSIAKRYPSRDLSNPTTMVRLLDHVIRGGFASDVVQYTLREDAQLPFLTSFFVPALAAARAGMRKVFCIVTDTDLNRVWVARDPARSPVIYCAPTWACRRRLLAYGVPEGNIHLTGFPLPRENTATVRSDLAARLARLDPQQVFYPRLKEVIEREVGVLPAPMGRVTITYAVGGAGAQSGVASQILRSAARFIRDGRLRINLVAGVRTEVARYFEEQIDSSGLASERGEGVRVLLCQSKAAYFDAFNLWLRDTDLLWTKPGELVFYAALGIPLVMTEPLGAHEEFNREWILDMGAGLRQEDPRFAGEWLVEWAGCGLLAEAAFDGFLKAPRHGAENILKLLAAPDRHDAQLEFGEACFSPSQLRRDREATRGKSRRPQDEPGALH